MLLEFAGRLFCLSSANMMASKNQEFAAMMASWCWLPSYQGETVEASELEN
jgi:hypothetical protein